MTSGEITKNGRSKCSRIVEMVEEVELELRLPTDFTGFLSQ